MKCLSSIFSFNTLKITGCSLKALCLCLCFFGVAEFSARFMLQQGYLDPSGSLQTEIENNLSLLEKNKPTVWLIGNSTLAYINTEGLNDFFCTTPIKMIHGGATLRGTAAMLNYYLEHTKAIPEHIIIFIFKDDLNANGATADDSKRYLEFMSWKKYVRWNYSRLRTIRDSLYKKIMTIWTMLFVERKDIAAWNQKYRVSKAIITPKEMASAFMRNYAFDSTGFSLAATVCRSRGVKKISVILLPISKAYAQWHDRMFPHMRYRNIRQNIKSLCERLQFNLIDAGDPLPGQFFGDFFHANPTGSGYIYNLLIRQFSEQANKDNFIKHSTGLPIPEKL